MVKTLMQSQHKAVAKDLKLGTFDDKIDSYLGSNPELLPRKGGVAKTRGATEVKVEPPAPPQDDTTVRAATDADPTPTDEETVRVEADEDPTPTDEETAPPSVFTDDVEDTDASATTQIPRDAAGELFGHDTQELSEIAEKVTRSHNEKVAGEKAEIAAKTQELAKQRELHAEEMFAHARAEISSVVEVTSSVVEVDASVVEVDSSDSERLYVEERVSESLDERVPEPILATNRSGSYAIIRPTQSAPEEVVTKEPSRPVKQQAQQTKKSTRPVVTPPRQRQPTGKQQPPTSRRRASTAQQVSSGTSNKAPRPATSRRRSSVVVSRPAVIIGAPPKVIGGERPRRPSTRKARSNLFGKDLISEKSLDEVIMAYLSEDGNEEEK